MKPVVLYTALDGRDAIVVPDFQHTTLKENLRYTYAVIRTFGYRNQFTQRDLVNRSVTRLGFEDLPDPVKALIVLYDI